VPVKVPSPLTGSGRLVTVARPPTANEYSRPLAVTHDRLLSGSEFFAGSPAHGRVSQFKQSSD
jgi:hypothetical protein